MPMLPPANGAHQGSVAVPAAEPQSVIEQAVMAAMATAINSGLFTCTASLAGKLQPDVQSVVRLLKGYGYTTSISGTTLTVSW